MMWCMVLFICVAPNDVLLRYRSLDECCTNGVANDVFVVRSEGMVRTPLYWCICS